MKLLSVALVLCASLCVPVDLRSEVFSPAIQTVPDVVGDWSGSSTVHGQSVPVHLRIAGTPGSLRAELINGPERSAASSVSLSGNRLLVSFSYFARTLDLTVGADHVLSGSFGTAAVRYPVTFAAAGARRAVAQESVPKIAGEWEIAVKSVKGESAWRLRVDEGVDPAEPGLVEAVIQRIDGDTGALYGRCGKDDCVVSHFTPAGPALYRLRREADTAGGETLLVSNLLRADQTVDSQQNLVARRPSAARAAKLPEPTEPTEQTTMKDPTERFRFKAPDLTGRIVSSTDPQFDGKVVIVTVGGSWCPNCHDEAPVLENLYKEFHSRGLEVVNLSFEEDEEQIRNPARLRAFLDRYHIEYTVLLAGTTDQLSEKVPQADHLNCWPTSFVLGRDGRVREIHAGFTGPANLEAHKALVAGMTHLVERLIDEPVPAQSARDQIDAREREMARSGRPD